MPPTEVIIRGTLSTGPEGSAEQPIAPTPPPHPWLPPFGGGHPITIPGLPHPAPPIYIPPGGERPSQLPVIRPDRPSNPIELPPVYPSGGPLPGGGHPSTGPLPSPGHPSTGLPIAPGHPSTGPVPPQPGLTPPPGTVAPPIAVAPPTTKPIEPASYILVWSPVFGWCYVELGAVTPLGGGGSTLPAPPGAQPK